jgi:hypothetical protein
MTVPYSQPHRGLCHLPTCQLRDLVARYIALRGVIAERYRSAVISEATAILNARIGGVA